MTSPHPELESERPEKDAAAHSEAPGADAGGVYADLYRTQLDSELQIDRAS